MKSSQLFLLSAVCLLLAACETSSGFSLSLSTSFPTSNSLASNGETSNQVSTSMQTTSVSITSNNDSSQIDLSSINNSSSLSSTNTSMIDSSSGLVSSEEDTYPSIYDVLTILYNDGYVDLEVVNTPLIRSGRESYLNTTYGLSVTVTGFYEGYVPDHTRWVRLHVLESILSAMYVYNAFANNNPDFHHLDRFHNIVLETESYATWALFHSE